MHLKYALEYKIDGGTMTQQSNCKYLISTDGVGIADELYYKEGMEYFALRNENS